VTNPQLGEVWPEILGFYPVYGSDGGNSTCVLLSDGSRYMDRRKTKTLLHDMAKIFAADLSALRYNYRDFLGRKGLVPLPLHKNLILVPFRVRRVKYKDHGATGYAVLNKIEAVESVSHPNSNGAMSRISLSGGITLECMEKPVTVNRRLAEAHQVRREYYRFNDGDRLLDVQELAQSSFLTECEGRIVYHIHYHAGALPG